MWIYVVALVAQIGGTGSAQEPTRADSTRDAEVVTLHATGTFEVELTKQPMSEVAKSENLGRMSIKKTFDGDLEGTSNGEMLTAYGNVEGSAGYVAMERVEGTLLGRSGSFLLQHSATMAGGEQRQSITIVPDSGTAELTGIEGRMKIRIDAGQHFYDFEFTLPER